MDHTEELSGRAMTDLSLPEVAEESDVPMSHGEFSIGIPRAHSLAVKALFVNDHDGLTLHRTKREWGALLKEVLSRPIVSGQ